MIFIFGGKKIQHWVATVTSDQSPDFAKKKDQEQLMTALTKIQIYGLPRAKPQ